LIEHLEKELGGSEIMKSVKSQYRERVSKVQDYMSKNDEINYEMLQLYSTAKQHAERKQKLTNPKVELVTSNSNTEENLPPNITAKTFSKSNNKTIKNNSNFRKFRKHSKIDDKLIKNLSKISKFSNNRKSR